MSRIPNFAEIDFAAPAGAEATAPEGEGLIWSTPERIEVKPLYTSRDVDRTLPLLSRGHRQG